MELTHALYSFIIYTMLVFALKQCILCFALRHKSYLTAVITNTRPRRIFFLPIRPAFSWTSINCFHGFPPAPTEKVPSPLNDREGRRLTRIISNDDSVFNYFIRMKNYIVKQRGLYELSEIVKHSL